MAPTEKTKPDAVTTPRTGQNVVSTKRTHSANPSQQSGQVTTAPTALRVSKWRLRYRVHPAADVFPMLPDDELLRLGEDIKRNGLKQSLTFFKVVDGESVLIDGRNRLEAMELAGIDPETIRVDLHHYKEGDPVAHIIGLNIYRRHLSKQEQADLIVAAVKAAAEAKGVSRQVGEKRKEGRPKDEVKAAAVASGTEYGISKRTVERSLAKLEPKKIAGPRLRAKPKLETHTGIAAARKYYLERFIKLDASAREAELETLMTEIKEVVGESLMQARRRNQGGDDLGDIPEFLDRRRRP
jgi:hypothetical protein